jgi:hypothetical protein
MWAVGATITLLNLSNPRESLEELWARELAVLVNPETDDATRPVDIERGDIGGLPGWAVTTAILAGAPHVALEQLRPGCLPQDQLPEGWQALRYPGAAGQPWVDWASAPRKPPAAAAASGARTRGQAQVQGKLRAYKKSPEQAKCEASVLALAAARQRFCQSSAAADELDASLHWALGWCLRWQPEVRPSALQMLRWAEGWLGGVRGAGAAALQAAARGAAGAAEAGWRGWAGGLRPGGSEGRASWGRRWALSASGRSRLLRLLGRASAAGGLFLQPGWSGAGGAAWGWRRVQVAGRPGVLCADRAHQRQCHVTLWGRAGRTPP